jgi:hypothetical protein
MGGAERQGENVRGADHSMFGENNTFYGNCKRCHRALLNQGYHPVNATDTLDQAAKMSKHAIHWDSVPSDQSPTEVAWPSGFIVAIFLQEQNDSLQDLR